MRKLVATVSAAPVALALVLAGCAATAALDPDVERCLAEWNAPANAQHRATIGAEARGFDVELLAWYAVQPGGPELRGDGCTYTFFSAERSVTVNASWTLRDELRWGGVARAPVSGLTFRSSGRHATADGHID